MRPIASQATTELFYYSHNLQTNHLPRSTLNLTTTVLTEPITKLRPVSATVLPGAKKQRKLLHSCAPAISLFMFLPSFLLMTVHLEAATEAITRTRASS